MPESLKPTPPTEQDEQWEEQEHTEEPSAKKLPDAAMRPPGPVVRWWRRLTTLQRAILIIVVTSVLVVGAFFAPPEGDSNNVTGDLPSTPTVVATNMVEKVTIDHTFTYQGIQITVLDASLATKFSDDRNRGGVYTLRVMVQTKNPGNQNVGLPYKDLFKLVNAGGATIEPKRLGLKPQEQPGESQTSFVDFPVDQKVPLSSFTLRFADNISVPFGK
ncbi:MAG: hypothetical protein J2P36_25680 [Ktedonobacteraceae bacterium]|nr:hypothetical protein [Ktedonobacteraceae bacterium]